VIRYQEFQGARIEHVRGADYGDDRIVADLDHGSGVAAKVIGRNLGIVKSATAVILDKKTDETGPQSEVLRPLVIEEKYLESLLNAAEDIASKGRSGKSVLSISWGHRRNKNPAPFFDIMRKSPRHDYCFLFPPQGPRRPACYTERPVRIQC